MRVPYTYPHDSNNLPDIDQALLYCNRYSEFYLTHKVEFEYTIEIGQYDIRVIFVITKST